ncbi:SPOR domain-containing protein [Sulfuricurvum sp.]|jgi:hypothetical protein|uniref:SPOR domain-containing protein n=1 Tax=Sulfuricurvum sp. TaxID=2025608 RepID=UPI00261E4EAE|nr:SPOR domain-containing protein [Sulfuricurvum sp.]MDD2781087.1 SPOR domain-containing protein [Sulfuricurvum sp.]
MRKNGLTFIVLSCMILFSAMQTFAAEAKGYKIVLASFASFDEAKSALEKLGSKVGENELVLQKEYRFDIVARPSGKAFMLAIEPLETQQGAESVLKQFKKHYPDAYINGYFGPTQGALFFKPAESNSPTTEVNATEANTTAEAVKSVEENSSTPATPIVKTATTEANVTEEGSVSEEANSNSVWMIIALVLFGAIVWGVWKKTKSKESVQEFKEKYEETIQEEESEDRLEVIESEAFVTVDEDETPPPSEPKLFEPEPDIFYKLKKNMFFITLMGELKTAADNKDDQRCHDLMDEVLRYQKNFRKSDIIAKMQKFIETKAYDQLSSFINREID